ncbi:hypothetical protein [Streptomyces justiciae]|uniref:hypothetical protein n=1 Tax=Streptomyces justiciae TaxID=2780140 RepID=UPI0018810C4E|nr:hypothetical protein [Streptomyces justiciae]MBE8474185.1 hypothetical protein [Streptomyces justiciae]
MSADNTTPARPPQGPHQPRWAWWVVGIVIPVVGILITVLMNGPGSSDDKAADDTDTVRPTTSADEKTATTPPPTKSPAADRVLYGPDEVKVDLSGGGAMYIDLDTSEPLLSGSDIKGADLIYQTTGDDPTLYTPDSALTLAPLAGSGDAPAPTASECADAVESNGAYTGTAQRGGRFCLLTGEGRVAYLRVVAVPPGRGVGRLDVTVWDTPAA